MRITMIGHSTVLIETGGLKILTDPFFSQSNSLAYRRVEPPALSREELCDVNLVLVSHPHFDHVDGAYLRMLPAGTPVVTSLMGSGPLKLMRGKNLMAAHPGRSLRFGPLEIFAVPAIHFAMTVGFILLADGLQVYFAGDTFYGPFMKQIGEHFQLDLALIPVTTFAIPMTMGNGGAVKAVRDLRPGMVIPIHEGLRPTLPFLRRKETPESFQQKLGEARLHAQVMNLKNGQGVEI